MSIEGGREQEEKEHAGRGWQKKTNNNNSTQVTLGESMILSVVRPRAQVANAGVRSPTLAAILISQPQRTKREYFVLNVERIGCADWWVWGESEKGIVRVEHQRTINYNNSNDSNERKKKSQPFVTSS